MAKDAETYQSAKQRQLEEQGTYRVYGRPLGSEVGRWWPVSPCFCVQDSPDNPCKCPPWIWWLRTDMILGEGDAGRKDHDGKELRYYDVAVESNIMIESTQTVSAGVLKGLGSDLARGDVSGTFGVGGGSGLGVIAQQQGPLSSDNPFSFTCGENLIRDLSFPGLEGNPAWIAQVIRTYILCMEMMRARGVKRPM